MGPNSGEFLGLSGSDMGPGGYDPLLGSSPAFTDEDRAMMRAGAGPKPNNHLYKTELCRNWEKMGTCPYGIKCQFAHGGHELRPSLKSRYRHEICRSFAVNGTCRFGARCRFLHVGPGSGLELLPDPSPYEMAAAAAAAAAHGAGGGGYGMGWGGAGSPGGGGGGGGGLEADTLAALLAAGVDPAQLAAAGLFNLQMTVPPGLEHASPSALLPFQGHQSRPHHSQLQQVQQQHMGPPGGGSPGHPGLPGAAGSPGGHQDTPGSHHSHHSMRQLPAAASLLGTPDRGMLHGGIGSSGGGPGGGGGGMQGLGPSAFMAQAAACGRGGGGGYGGPGNSSRNLLGALSQRSRALSEVLSPMQPAGSLRGAGSGLPGMGGVGALGAGGGGGGGGGGWMPGGGEEYMQGYGRAPAAPAAAGGGGGNGGGNGGEGLGLSDVGALVGAGIPLQDALAFLQQQQWQLLNASGPMGSAGLNSSSQASGGGGGAAFGSGGLGSGDMGSGGVSGEMLGWGDTPARNFPPIGSPAAGDFIMMSTPMKVAPHTPPNAGRGGHSSMGHAGAMFPQQGEGWGGVISTAGGVNVSEASSAVSATGGQLAAAAAHSTSPTTTTTTTGGVASRGSPAGNLPGVSASGGGGIGGGSGFMAFSPAGAMVKAAPGEMSGVSVMAPGGAEGDKGPGSPPAADANSEMLTEGMLQLLTPMKLTS